MSHGILNKKAKKKLQLKKNKHQQEIFQAMHLRAAEAERVEGLEREREKPRSEEKHEEVWSAKVGTIRNRLTNQRRDSKERWNRFAGTSDAGARGL